MVRDSFILIAEDDSDDRFLLEAAFKENGFKDRLVFVENGLELMKFLDNSMKCSGASGLPKFILLDLNMPKKDGRESLAEIKQHAAYKAVPVVIFSTTNNDQEMRRCYDLGANSYVSKPLSFECLIKIVANLRAYWMQTSQFPE